MSEQMNDQAGSGSGLGLPVAPPAPPAPSQTSVASAALPGESDALRILHIDMTGVATEFVPVPVGLYPAVVDEVEYVAASKKSGQPGLKWSFVTTTAPYVGRKFYYHTSLVEQAMWKVAKTLDALGMEGVANNPDVKLDLDEMVGLPCILSISIGSYNKKPKNEVVDVLPASDLGAIPAPF